jgi:hypothetical protein
MAVFPEVDVAENGKDQSKIPGGKAGGAASGEAPTFLMSCCVYFACHLCKVYSQTQCNMSSTSRSAVMFPVASGAWMCSLCLLDLRHVSRRCY